MLFVVKIKLSILFILSNQSFNDTLDLLLMSNHYVYIKDFNRLMFNVKPCENKKNKCKNKK